MVSTSATVALDHGIHDGARLNHGVALDHGGARPRPPLGYPFLLPHFSLRRRALYESDRPAKSQHLLSSLCHDKENGFDLIDADARVFPSLRYQDEGAPGEAAGGVGWRGRAAGGARGAWRRREAGLLQAARGEPGDGARPASWRRRVGEAGDDARGAFWRRVGGRWQSAGIQPTVRGEREVELSGGAQGTGGVVCSVFPPDLIRPSRIQRSAFVLTVLPD